MTHLAVTGTVDGKSVTWMEKVTDEQYNAAAAPAQADDTSTPLRQDSRPLR